MSKNVLLLIARVLAHKSPQAQLGEIAVLARSQWGWAAEWVLFPKTRYKFILTYGLHFQLCGPQFSLSFK